MDASGATVNNDNHNDTHQDTRKDNESYRRIELITGTTRRRRWSDDERARILAESFEPGANISAVARRHGVHGGLLHSWRKQAKTRAEEAAQADPRVAPRIYSLTTLWTALHSEAAEASDHTPLEVLR